MKNIFTLKENTKVSKNDVIVKCINASRFGIQSLSSLGSKIWNNLPSNVKSETSFLKFKEYIKTWLGLKCRCKVCIKMWTENVMLFMAPYIECVHLTIWHQYIFSVSVKNLFFIIFIYFFDKVSNFCNSILTNQKREMVVSNCQCNIKGHVFNLQFRVWQLP